MAQELFEGYEITDKQVLASYGSFKKMRYWIKGWHSELARYGCILFIFGSYGGQETELTRDEVHSVCTFEVKQDSAVRSVEAANL